MIVERIEKMRVLIMCIVQLHLIKFKKFHKDDRDIFRKLVAMYNQIIDGI